MDVKPAEGSYTDVVVSASWLCTADETIGTPPVTYTTALNGSVAFQMPEGTFTPYDQLTQEQVLDWCWADGVDKSAIEAAAQTNIDAQINPPVVQLPLPWVATEEA